MRRTKAGIPVVRVHYSADPTMTPEIVAKMRSEYSSDAHWKKEMEVDYGALGGALVYPEFSPAIHVIPDSEIPRTMCRYVSIDPHPRTPHAFLWAGIDAWNDVYIYRELWPSRMYGDSRKMRDDEEENVFSIKEYAETCAYLEGNRIEWRNPNLASEYGIYRYNSNGEKIIYRLMDQAGKAFNATAEGQAEENYAARYARFGVQCRDPKKSHQAGEDAIREYLKPRRHDSKGLWPRLHIAASCEEIQLEFGMHRYQKTKTVSEERDLKQDRAKARCHMLDNLRYLLVSDLRFTRSLAS